jgi:hypothetical protein
MRAHHVTPVAAFGQSRPPTFLGVQIPRRLKGMCGSFLVTEFCNGLLIKCFDLLYSVAACSTNELIQL